MNFRHLIRIPWILENLRHQNWPFSWPLSDQFHDPLLARFPLFWPSLTSVSGCVCTVGVPGGVPVMNRTVVTVSPNHHNVPVPPHYPGYCTTTTRTTMYNEGCGTAVVHGSLGFFWFQQCCRQTRSSQKCLKSIKTQKFMKIIVLLTRSQ